MTKKSKLKIIVVLGPTASGKSALAVKIARLINGEVISADSRQVYRGLDIGSGKITKREMRGVPHHLLDVANPKRQFSVVQYRKLALYAITDIVKRGKVPILCGGTGFYIQSIISGIILPEVPPNPKLRKKLETKGAIELFAMLKELDPRRSAEIDANNSLRLIRAIEIATVLGYVPPVKVEPSHFDVLQIGISIDRDTLREKITTRLTKRMKKGMLAEGRHLHADGLSWKRMCALGLEYRAMADLLTGTTTRTEMVHAVITESMQYAKRQMTWFKRDKTIKWFAANEQTKILKEVKKFLSF